MYRADIIDFLYFELDLVLTQQINQILLIDLYHGAAQLVSG